MCLCTDSDRKKLIKLVKESPIVWNFKRPSLKDLSARNLQWKKIGQQFSTTGEKKNNIIIIFAPQHFKNLNSIF